MASSASLRESEVPEMSAGTDHPEQQATVRILPDPEEGPVTPSGPLRSVQAAEVTMPPAALERLWRPATLERLARAYWRYLGRISLGLLKVGYSETGRFVVLGWRRLVLLRFRPPEFDMGPGFGRVTWPIERGLVRANRGLVLLADAAAHPRARHPRVPALARERRPPPAAARARERLRHGQRLDD